MKSQGKGFVHLIPHFHYDTVYLQVYEQYLHTALEHITEALRIMATNPEYTFMIEQTILLREYWERYPEQRSLIRLLAAEGRLDVACGMYCMPDLNIPSGESLIKQTAMGKRWLKETLCIDAKAAWMSDCFGHHPQLPQLLEQCGYEGYFFARGMDENAYTPFWWEGIDGTRMLTHRLHGGYGLVMFSDAVQNKLELTLNEHPGAHAIESCAERLSSVSTSPHLLLPNGGDMAKPQWESVSAVDQYNKRHGKTLRCEFSTVSRFLAEIGGNNGEYPVVHVELNPVFQGTYSSRMAIKLWNRKLEWKLQLAERLHATLSLSARGPDSGEKVLKTRIEEAWQQLLFNQFHDIICGTILDEGYQDAIRRYKAADGLLDNVLEDLNGQWLGISSSPSIATPTLEMFRWNVFNPSGFERTETVSFSVETEADLPNELWILDDAGARLKAAVTLRSAETLGKQCIQLSFTDRFPALGSKSYRLRDCGECSPFEDESCSLPLTYSITESETGMRFENAHMRVDITHSGGILGLRLLDQPGDEWVDRESGEWNDLLLLSDTGDFWLYDEPVLNGAYRGATPENGRLEYKDTLPYSRKLLSRTSGCQAKLSVVENGPDRVVLVSIGSLNFWRMSIPFEKKIILYANTAKMGFETRLTGNGKQYRIVAAFPTMMSEGKHIQQIPFGAVERGEGEYTAQNWAALQADDRGLLVANAGIPGNGVLNGMLYIALFRSVAMPYKAESEMGYEQGKSYTYSYEVLPFAGRSLADVHPEQVSEQLNLPLWKAISADFESSSLPGWKVVDGPFYLSAFYKEEGNWVIRVYDPNGVGGEGQLVYCGPSTDVTGLSCWESDALGNKRTNPIEWNGSLSIRLTSFQIKTFVIGRL